MRYKAFLSYSHAADGRLAPALQSALHRFAKPWYRLRAIRVFRDETGLGVTPVLWPSIERALGESEFFLLMASPQATCSKWVEREIAWWLGNRSPERLLIIWTEGNLAWGTQDFDWSVTDCLPGNLTGVFHVEPKWSDLRWVKDEEHLSTNHPKFRNAIAELAGTLHNRPVDELSGEDVRQHRRAVRLVCFAVVALATLTLLLGGMTYLAELRRKEAEEQRQIAYKQRQIALARHLALQAELVGNQNSNVRDRSLLLGIEAMLRFPCLEADQAMRSGLVLFPRLLARLAYDAQLTGVTFSPDGVHIAATGEGSSAGIWEVRTGREIKRLKCERSSNAIAFSPDGRYIATGSRSGPTTLWDVESGREVAHLDHGVADNCVAFPSTSVYLATAYVATANSNGLRLWELVSHHEVKRLDFGFEAMRVAFSPNGLYVVAISPDGAAKVWETTTALEVGQISCGSLPAALACSPNGKHIAVSFVWFYPLPQRFRAHVWELSSHRKVSEVEHFEEIDALTFSPDGKHLATASWEGTVKVSEVTSGKRLACMIHGHISDLRFSSDGKYLATAAGTNACIWEAHGTGEVARMENAASVCFSSDERMICAKTMDSSVIVCETDHAHELSRIASSGERHLIIVNRDAQFLTVQRENQTVRICELVNGRELASIELDSNASPRSFSPNGTLLATPTGQDSPSFQLWQLQSGRESAKVNRQSLEGPETISMVGSLSISGNYPALIGICSTNSRSQIILETPPSGEFFPISMSILTLSRDGKYLAASTKTGRGGHIIGDNTAWVWETSSGRLIASMRHEKERLVVEAVAFSPNCKYLATASTDNTARVWDILTGKELVRLNHDRSVTAVAFSPDGRHIATGSWDHTARVWEVANGREVCRITHDNKLTGIAFSPGGRFIATMSIDRVARAWRWRAEDLIVEACARLTRNLTVEEWKLYIGDESYRKTCPALP